MTNVRREGPNAYLDLFYRALAAQGIQHVGQWEPRRSWIATRADTIDAVHFHWPETYWRQKDWLVRQLAHFPSVRPLRKFFERRRRRRLVASWCGLLREIKNQNLLIVWTVHNLHPHERSSHADLAAYQCLAEMADLVICHAESTRDQFRRYYETNAEVVVMPHGNYGDSFPPARPPETVRSELGLRTDLPVVACLGQIRPYKGVDLLCAAVARLGGAVQLLVGGMPTKVDRTWLRAQVAAVPQSVLIDRPLSAAEFSDLAGAADILALPYRQVTGSGALLAALTLQRGVVAADLPYFREVLSGAHDAGILFKPDDEIALAEAIQTYLQTPGPVRAAAATKLAGCFDWPTVAHPIATQLLALSHSRSR